MNNKNTSKILDLSSRKGMFYWQTNRPISEHEQREIFLDRHRAVNREETLAAIRYGLKEAGASHDIEVQELSDPIDFGSVNSVLKAKLSNGLEIVVRMHPKGVVNGYFWAEKAATDAARGLGVPTFETIFINDDFSVFPFAFMIMTACPGETIQANSTAENYPHLETISRQTGKIAALIHSVRPEGFGFFNNEIAKRENKLVGQYDSFSEHIFAALDEDLSFLSKHDVINDPLMKQMNNLFLENQTLLECKVPALIHNDIADWNQLAEGPEITGMLDWDECFSGNPVMEFAAYSLFYGEPRVSWFKEGYQEISALPEQFDETFELFKLRYLISKMHLRTKRALVSDDPLLKQNIERGYQAMKEICTSFGL